MVTLKHALPNAMTGPRPMAGRPENDRGAVAPRLVASTETVDFLGGNFELLVWKFIKSNAHYQKYK